MLQKSDDHHLGILRKKTLLKKWDKSCTRQGWFYVKPSVKEWDFNYQPQLGVSKNSGTPKSSILIGFSIINHPFWGYPVPLFLEIAGFLVAINSTSQGRRRWKLRIFGSNRFLVEFEMPLRWRSTHGLFFSNNLASQHLRNIIYIYIHYIYMVNICRLDWYLHNLTSNITSKYTVHHVCWTKAFDHAPCPPAISKSLASTKTWRHCKVMKVVTGPTLIYPGNPAEKSLQMKSNIIQYQTFKLKICSF